MPLFLVEPLLEFRASPHAPEERKYTSTYNFFTFLLIKVVTIEEGQLIITDQPR